MNRQLREELKALSMDLFGRSSKWQDFVEGVATITTLEKEVKDEKTGEVTKQKEYVNLNKGKGKPSFAMTIERHEPEVVLEKLKEFKVQRDEFLAKQAKEKAEKERKQKEEEAAKLVSNEAAGSAIKA